MSRTTRIGIIVLAIIGAVFSAVYPVFRVSYDTLNEIEVVLDQFWDDVDEQYRRRCEITKELEQTVIDSVGEEQVRPVTEARLETCSLLELGKTLAKDPTNLARFDTVQTRFTRSLDALLASADHYPELRRDGHFLVLQRQLRDINIDIREKRDWYDANAEYYNAYLREFPRSVVAMVSGISERPVTLP